MFSELNILSKDKLKRKRNKKRFAMPSKTVFMHSKTIM